MHYARVFMDGDGALRNHGNVLIHAVERSCRPLSGK